MSWAITAATVAITAYQINESNKAAQQQQEQIVATTQMNYVLKQQQEQEAKAQTGMQLTQEAIKRNAERGKIRAAQGESGVAGASPLRVLANSYLQQAITAGSIVSKGEATQRSLALENVSTYFSSMSDWNRVESQKTEGMDTVIRLGAAGLQGYSMGSSIFGTGASAGAAGGVAQTGEVAGGRLINSATSESVWLTPEAAQAVRSGGTMNGGWYLENVSTIAR